MSSEPVVLQNRRMIRRISRALLLSIIGASALHGGAARADLGGDIAGVFTDAAQLHGAVNQQALGSSTSRSSVPIRASACASS